MNDKTKKLFGAFVNKTLQGIRNFKLTKTIFWVLCFSFIPIPTIVTIGVIAIKQTIDQKRLSRLSS